MPTKNQIRIVIAITIFLALTLYHLSNKFFAPIDKDLAVIFKIGQIATMAALFALAGYNKYAAKLFFRELYIAGRYEGTSKAYLYDDHFIALKSQKKETPTAVYKIEFSIQQNLFETTIRGHSYIGENKDLLSTWSGKLFSVDDSHFYFGLQLTTDRTEYGVLKATLDSNSLKGFYFSGEPRTEAVFEMSATKKTA